MGKAVNAEGAMQLVDDIAASVDRNLSALISLVRLKKCFFQPNQNHALR